MLRSVSWPAFCFLPWPDLILDSAAVCSHVCRVQTQNKKTLPTVEAAVYLEGERRPETEEKEGSSGSIQLEILTRQMSNPIRFWTCCAKVYCSRKTFLIFILYFLPTCLHSGLSVSIHCPSISFIPQVAWAPVCRLPLRPWQYIEPAHGAGKGTWVVSCNVSWKHCILKRAHKQ